MPGGRFAGCANCNGRCCYDYLVPITGYDAYVIASRSLLSMEQFVVVLPEETATPLGFVLDGSEQTYSLVLDKQRRSRAKRKPCVFLLTLPNGQGRCGIYSFRPLVCQTYPAMLHRGGVTVRDDVMCTKGSWNIAAMDLPEWRLSLLRGEMETAIYRTVVTHWNEGVRHGKVDKRHSPFEYFGYVMNAYSRIEAVRHTHAKMMPDVVRQWGSSVSPRPDWRRFLSAVDDTMSGPSLLGPG